MKKRLLSIVGLTAVVMLLFAVSCRENAGEGISQEASAHAETTASTANKTWVLPRIDGSTANIPMATLMLQRYGKLTEEEALALTTFSTTPNAYLNLISGGTDLLLVYEADVDTKKQIDREYGESRLEYHPIGVDALVFIANEGNPVTGLTTEQIREIYAGTVKNWSGMGGENREIVAFQREPGSGSQALMTKLVMKDIAMAEPPTERISMGMGSLIDALAEYNNTKNALGYSVFYYASTMYQKPGLRFMSVDGVTPSNTSISDGSYPFTNEFYAVIRRDEEEGSKARNMLEWILSADGRQAIVDAGYVAK